MAEDNREVVDGTNLDGGMYGVVAGVGQMRLVWSWTNLAQTTRPRSRSRNYNTIVKPEE
jgi:hypothetical protein